MAAKNKTAEKELRIKPKWYRRKARRQYKAILIQEIITEYTKPVKAGKHTLPIPDEKEVEDYAKELNSLKINDLELVNQVTQITRPKYTLLDKLKKLKKRKAIIVRIYHKNSTSTDYVSIKYSRLARINEYKYLIPPDKGVRDNKHNMVAYAYFENNPFPMSFEDDRPSTVPDAELMENTLHFEFAQKMAKVTEMTKKLDITLVFALLAFLISAAHFIFAMYEAGVFN